MAIMKMLLGEYFQKQVANQFCFNINLLPISLLADYDINSIIGELLVLEQMSRFKIDKKEDVGAVVLGDQ